MYTQDSWTNPPHYYPLYERTCDDCRCKFDTNEADDYLCYDCKQNRDDQIIIAGEILELIDQLKYPVDGQDYFVRKIEILINEIEWED